MQKTTYHAFISYNYDADFDIAFALRNALHRFARPYYKLRAMRVFLDRSSMPAAASLRPEIVQNLESSEYLILIASPGSANSHWVQREIDWWLENKDKDKLLIVLSSGDAVWDGRNNDFDWKLTTALPKTLKGRIGGEPLYVDLREANRDKISMRQPVFKQAVVDLSSKITGKEKDTLIGEDVRHQRLVRTLSILAVTFILGFAVFAELQRRQAVKQRDVADDFLGRMYVASGDALTRNQDAWGGLVWYNEALHRDSSDPVRAKIHRLRVGAHLRHNPTLAQMWPQRMPLNYVEFSSDGKRVVIAGGATYDDDSVKQGEARVFDVQSGRMVGRPMRHKGCVYSASFSPDGRQVVTASGDNSARIWDVDSGEPLTEPLKCDGVVRRAYFSPDGDRIITASSSLRIWETSTGKPMVPLIRENFESSAWFAHYSPDGKWIVTAHAAPYMDSGGGGFQVVRAADGKTQTRYIEHGDRWIYHAAFSPDGKRVATAAMGNSADLWDTESGKAVASYKHPDRVSRVIFNNNGTELITACWDGKLRLWDTTMQQEEPGMVLEHGGKILYAELSPDGRLLASLSSDGTARVWDLIHKRALTPPLVHSKSSYRTEGGREGIRPGSEAFVAFSPNGRHLAAVGWEGVALVWDLAVSELDAITPLVEVPRPLLPAPQIFPPKTLPKAPDITASKNGRWQAKKISRKSVQLWDVDSHSALGPVVEHRGHVNDIRFSPNDQYLVTTAGGLRSKTSGEVHVWNLGTGKTTELNLNHPGPADKIIFSSDDRQLAVVMGSDYFLKGYGLRDENVDDYTVGETRIWDLKNGEALTPPFNQGGYPGRVFFNPRGDRLIMADFKSVTIWDSGSGDPITSKMAHDDDIYTIKFNHDRTLLVTTSADWTARVWDAHSGAAITRPLRHPEPHQRNWTNNGVTLADFSPDGALVVTACSGGLVRVWNASTGQPVSPFWYHNDRSILSVAFAEDGSGVRTQSADGTRYRWIVDPEIQSSVNLRDVTQLMARRRLDPSSTLEPLTAAEHGELFKKIKSQQADSLEVGKQHVALWHHFMAVGSEINSHPLSAAFHLEKLNKYQPGAPYLYIRLGDARALLNHLDASVESYTRAIDLDPRNWKTWSHRANAFIRFKRWEQAVKDYGKMTELHPTDVSLQADLALLNLVAGNVDTCRRQLKELVDMATLTSVADFPYYRILETLLAISMDIQTENDRIQIERLTTAIGQTGENSYLSYLMGPVLYRQGTHAQAKEKMLALKSRYPYMGSYKIQIFMAMLEAIEGNRKKASALLKNAKWNFSKNDGTLLAPTWQDKIVYALVYHEALRLLNQCHPGHGNVK